MTTIAEAAPGRVGALRAGDDGRPTSLGLLGVAGLLWLALAALVLLWPDAQKVERTRALGLVAAGLGVAQLAAWLGGWVSPRLARLGRFAPWLVVLAGAGLASLLNA